MRHGIGTAMRLPIAAFVALFSCIVRSSADTKSDQLKAFREGLTVDLPPFLVMEEDAPKGTRPWRYLSVPGLEVISKCSDDTTNWFVGEFLQRLAELRAIVPAHLQFEHAVPTALILIPPELRVAMGKEIVRMVVEHESGGSGRRAINGGRVTSHLGMISQVCLTDLESGTMMIELTESDRVGISLTPSYVLAALEGRVPSLPYWFRSIMFSLYQQIHWSDAQMLTIPPVSWPMVEVPVGPGTENHAGFKAYKKEDGNLYRLVPAPLIPIREFLAGPPVGVGKDAEAHLDLWHDQGSLFLYWAFDDRADKERARRNALWEYVDRASREPSTEALFKSSFGVGFEAMDKVLSDYLAQALAEPLNLLSVDSIVVPGFHLVNADPATRARIQGDFVLKEMRNMARTPLSQYIPLYSARAEAILAGAYQDGARDGGLLSILGLYYKDTGRDEEARPLLDEAVKARVERPSTYLKLAQVLYKESLDRPTGSSGKLGNDQAATVMKLLKDGAAFEPPLVATYLLAVDVCDHAESPPSSADIAFIKQGLGCFPGNELLINAADRGPRAK
jgi:hypothetical protein